LNFVEWQVERKKYFLNENNKTGNCRNRGTEEDINETEPVHNASSTETQVDKSTQEKVVTREEDSSRLNTQTPAKVIEPNTKFNTNTDMEFSQTTLV
jgi:hypothetical protein